MNEAIQSVPQISLLKKNEFPEELPRMLEEELRYFVRGLMEDTIFTSMHIHGADKEKGDLSHIFAVVGAGVFQSEAPVAFLGDVGVLWEWMNEKAKKTWRGSLSGILYPTFVSARVIHKDDWDIACNSITALKASTPLIVPP